MKAGNITEATLDDNVGRILRVIFVSGIFDHPHAGGGEVDTPDAAGGGAAGRDRRHCAAEESRRAAAAGCDEDSLDRRDWAECGCGAHGRRRQFAGAAEVRDRAAGRNQEARREARFEVKYALGVGMEGEDPAQDTPEARAKALKEAVDVAAHADVAVVVVGRYNKIEQRAST